MKKWRHGRDGVERFAKWGTHFGEGDALVRASDGEIVGTFAATHSGPTCREVLLFRHSKLNKPSVAVS